MKSAFTVVCDTREQAPWTFKKLKKKVKGVMQPLDVLTIRRGLKTGDYSILGYESKIVVERKSVADLVGTITTGRERFESELERMEEMDFAAVIIEGTWSDMLTYCIAKTEMNPVSLDSSILTFMMRYRGAHWLFRPSRFSAMKTAYKLFDLYMRRIRNGK